MYINWGVVTLFFYILMRMSGFVLINPFFGRSGMPRLFQAGFITMLAVTVFSARPGAVTEPGTLLEFALKLTLELCVGGFLSLLMRFFMFIPEQAGELVDTQMGMSMAKSYDPTSNSSSTPTATTLRMMMMLMFFAENGHLTLLNIMMTSGDIVPYGRVAFGELAANRAVELFANCVLLAVKLNFPILAAELLGQVGMGVLMKVIPQINVFAINIELKVIIGLVMLLMLMGPISGFLLEIETGMMRELRLALEVIRELP